MYKFSKEDCKKGGRNSQPKKAEIRRQAPTEQEAQVREIVKDLGYDAIYEYPVQMNGNQCFIDIYIPNINIGIEVDGSHGWHNAMKMEAWDEIKSRICEQLGIRLVYINSRQLCPEYIKSLLCSSKLEF